MTNLFCIGSKNRLGGYGFNWDVLKMNVFVHTLMHVINMFFMLMLINYRESLFCDTVLFL